MRKLKIMGTVFLLAFSLVKGALALDDAAISSLKAYPEEFNSYTGGTSIQYTLSDITEANILLEIYNNDGILIRTIDDASEREGMGNIFWDGKDLEGEFVPEGYYTARLVVSFEGGAIGVPEFQTVWGGWGNVIGKLYYPNGVSVDYYGNVYVVDSNNSRIQKFDEEGNFIMTWGARGTGDGQFYLPMAVDVDSEGYVYVADSYNNRIQKFDSDGIFIKMWGNYGSGSSQFRYPMGIAVDENNNVFVSDRDNHRIQKFDSDGNFLTEWGSIGIGDGQFQSPRGLDVDVKGNVYVADTNNDRIQKFSSSGEYLSKWGNYGIESGQFSGIKDIAVDAQSNVYVSDAGNNRIQVFDREGRYLTMWEHQFNDPTGIACRPGSNIYVADTRNHQIKKFVFSAGGQVVISDQVRILVDNSAPKSEIKILGTKLTDDWYVSDVTVTLSALDNLSGVDRVFYSLDGSSFQEGSSLSVVSEGNHIITYYGIDNAGNKEEINEISFKMDKTPPDILINSPEDIYYLHPDIVKMDFRTQDNVSGVKRTAVFLDGQEFDHTTGEIDLFHLRLANHEIKVQSENYAGLVSTKTLKFNVTASIDSLVRCLERLSEMGDISNEDILTGLKDKLKTDPNDSVVKNNLKAFINQVEAQKGKEISNYYADILITDAWYIINLNQQNFMLQGKIMNKKLKQVY